MYTPRRGDIVHFDFSPQVGREMKGPHYGLVISHERYSIATGWAVVCPITSKTDKVSGFQVPLPPGGRVRGVVLSSELRTIDFSARNVTFEGSAPKPLVDAVVSNVKQIID
ncbi:type II toxin-antitoxin system PemK/MazF family toxin [Azospirillum sp. sgz301742]